MKDMRGQMKKLRLKYDNRDLPITDRQFVTRHVLIFREDAN